VVGASDKEKRVRELITAELVPDRVRDNTPRIGIHRCQRLLPGRGLRWYTVMFWLLEFGEIYAGYYSQIQLVTAEMGEKGTCLAQVYLSFGGRRLHRTKTGLSYTKR
jgi:hypothetical protein